MLYLASKYMPPATADAAAAIIEVSAMTGLWLDCCIGLVSIRFSNQGAVLKKETKQILRCKSIHKCTERKGSIHQQSSTKKCISLPCEGQVNSSSVSCFMIPRIPRDLVEKRASAGRAELYMEHSIVAPTVTSSLVPNREAVSQL